MASWLDSSFSLAKWDGKTIPEQKAPNETGAGKSSISKTRTRRFKPNRSPSAATRATI
jgi:hypothetical protein